ncbi:hypothetical protein [Cohnella sp. 56]|uniref:hypothetical protein n=1 Tax=Cohnella sp. 56 TaxID=3113722 RepID=UPI0030EAD305
MKWTNATDSELLTIMAHDTMARASDIIAASDEYKRRHPAPKYRKVDLQQIITRRPAK